MPDVTYVDPETGYEWTAHFASEQEALDQAVADTQTYGGVAPQEVVGDDGLTLVDQQQIIAEATAS